MCAIVDKRDLIVFDEFTSVVDRRVGEVGRTSCKKPFVVLTNSLSP